MKSKDLIKQKKLFDEIYNGSDISKLILEDMEYLIERYKLDISQSDYNWICRISGFDCQKCFFTNNWILNECAIHNYLIKNNLYTKDIQSDWSDEDFKINTSKHAELFIKLFKFAYMIFYREEYNEKS